MVNCVYLCIFNCHINIIMKSHIKKSAKKQLEATIAEKFAAVITEIGYDATKLKREIKKAGKFIIKKIDRKQLKDKPEVTEVKPVVAPIKNIVKKVEKPLDTPKKVIAQKAIAVEKVIVKAAKAAEKKVKKVTPKPAETDAGAETVAPVKPVVVRVKAKVAPAIKPAPKAKTTKGVKK